MQNTNQLIILTPAEAAAIINKSIIDGFEKLQASLQVKHDKVNDVKYYTVAEFAKIKKVHPNTVRSWVDNKQIVAEQKGDGCKILIPISQAELML